MTQQTGAQGEALPTEASRLALRPGDSGTQAGVRADSLLPKQNPTASGAGRAHAPAQPCPAREGPRPGNIWQMRLRSLSSVPQRTGISSGGKPL